MAITRKNKKGFTLVEVLMSIVIVAMLYAALAVAFEASAANYTVNENILKSMNSARQSLIRITTDLRTANAVAVIGADSGDDPDNSQCSLVNVDGKDITYKFDSANKKLLLIVNSGDDAGSYTLCENVTAMTFNRATYADDPGKVRNVRMSMTVSIGGAEQTISTATVVRKNM